VHIVCSVEDSDLDSYTNNTCLGMKLGLQVGQLDNYVHNY